MTIARTANLSCTPSSQQLPFITNFTPPADQAASGNDGWKPPDSRCVKINCDASFVCPLQPAGLGIGLYLTVQTWKPGFDVSKAPDKATVWVQIPKMPVEWYRQDDLGELSAQIGKPIRIDINTLQAERGKFARLAIEVEFNKPLVNWVEIEGTWFKVKYKDIPEFCFGCGMIGHIAETYPGKRKAQPMETGAVHSTGAIPDPVVPVGVRHTGMAMEDPQTPSCEGAAKYGHWMKVARPTRPVPRRTVESRNTAGSGASSSGVMRMGNSFELGLAVDLLHEVHRDTTLPQFQFTKEPTVPMVFQTKEAVSSGKGSGKKKEKRETRLAEVVTGAQMRKQTAGSVMVPEASVVLGMAGGSTESVKQAFVYPKDGPVAVRALRAQRDSDSESMEDMVTDDLDGAGQKSKRKFTPPLATLRSDGLILEAGIPKQQRKANKLLEDRPVGPDLPVD
ncbi:hypothetical protein Tsubulata_031362 [Turnera subulata]|uniref:DUF4283 domain-containing protein n=1 Tax=Turnera subulata TaxID=218843 RepID=A0A9Q0FSW9_9ROSI|nr:hypothetical protein Tsubulata_031362 [Turnera subulata]